MVHQRPYPLLLPVQLQNLWISYPVSYLLNHAFIRFFTFTILSAHSLGNFAPDDFAEMHLHPNPVFSIPSDNIYMTCMTGTQSGRIFLGGKDGCVYEVAYQVSIKRILVSGYTMYSERTRVVQCSLKPLMPKACLKYIFLISTVVSHLFLPVSECVKEVSIWDSRWKHFILMMHSM